MGPDHICFLTATNYSQWAALTTLALKREDLWRYVDGNTNINNDTSSQTFAKNDAHASSIIARAVSEPLFHHVEVNLEHGSKRFWDSLADQFNKKDGRSRANAAKRLYSCAMNKNETGDDYLTRFNEAVSDCRRTGVKVDNEQLAEFFVNSLPASFDNFVSFQYHANENLQLDAVTSAFRIEARRLGLDDTKQVQNHVLHQQSKRTIELVHGDLHGPENTAIGGFKYLFILIDDFSNFFTGFLLKNKSDCLAHFKNFVTHVSHLHHPKPLACFRSDNGGEFISHEFSALTKSLGTVCPKSPGKKIKRIF